MFPESANPGEPVSVRAATLGLLRAFGMTTVFGNPGSTELPLFRDFPDDFRYVLGLQESVVLGMADGFAQARRNAAFVNLHASAGVGHALGNLFTAFRNQTPLVVTAGQQARSILPYEPFLFAQQATEFPRPFVKWAIEPARAQDVPQAIARAYYVAMQPPQGPVFVSVPVDDWDQPCQPVAPRRLGTALRGDRTVLAAIAAALDSANAPALVVGAGVARDGAWRGAIALAERHRARVFVAPLSARNSFPEDHPLFAGFLTAGREAIVADLARHDVVLALGGPMSLYHTEGFGPHVPEGTRVFLLVDDPAQASWAPEATATLTNLREGLDELLALCRPPERTSPPRRAAAPPLDGRVLSDAYVFQQLARLRPREAIVVEEAASSRGAMHDYLPILVEDGFYTCASGGLGHGMPAAIGVALGRTGEKVIAVLGDGAAMYAIQALWSAAQLDLPITFLILNNRRYEALHRFGPVFGLQTLVGTELDGIDFCALARGQGLAAERVDAADSLDAALVRALADRHPNLIDLRID